MAMKFELQEHLGKYPIVREIGSGATSRVYLARDPFADREVAIKVFLFDENINPQTERMMHKAFLAEAALAGKLSHPHIVEILDAVVEPEHSYLVMEYVPGTTLEAHSDVTNLLPLSKVVEIIFKCIRALEYAFQHGVIHRDIKPGNILLSPSGDTKVSDFGASFQQRHGQETTQISGVGSPAYMSPEQIRMEDITHQTDIYSLGVVMYRLLTGRLPYEANTQAGLSYAILNTVPARPVTLRPDLSPLLETPPARSRRVFDDAKVSDHHAIIPTGKPVHLESSEESRTLKGEVFAVVDYPFATVEKGLRDSASWCDVLILPFNTKHCHAPGPESLAVRIGRKSDQPAEDAYRIDFKYKLAAATPDYLRVVLKANSGPVGTRDYQITLEATPLDAARSFIHLSYSYGFGTMSRLLMQTYLSTSGSSKIGFTVTGKDDNGKPVYVGGMLGAVERNTMRYFLAIDAYLASLAAPPESRIEKRLTHWFAATERFPKQLHEMDQGQYLAMKKAEAGRVGKEL